MGRPVDAGAPPQRRVGEESERLERSDAPAGGPGDGRQLVDGQRWCLERVPGPVGSHLTSVTDIYVT